MTTCTAFTRYERGHVIPGEPFAGFDKHNGEIAGFHLDGLVRCSELPLILPGPGKVLGGSIWRLIQVSPIKGSSLKHKTLIIAIVWCVVYRILGFRIAPPVVGRVVNLTQLKPVTSTKLSETYFWKGALWSSRPPVALGYGTLSLSALLCVGKDTCFYGVCHYCRREEAACAEGEMMEGSVTLWLPDWYSLTTRRHPYQRTYMKGRKAR